MQKFSPGETFFNHHSTPLKLRADLSPGNGSPPGATQKLEGEFQISLSFSRKAQTEDYGIEIAHDQMHIHDFHATILYLLGMDHTRLTFRHAGRDYRLTDVAGNVIKQIVA
jgi:hypothetical protein